MASLPAPTSSTTITTTRSRCCACKLLLVLVLAAFLCESIDAESRLSLPGKKKNKSKSPQVDLSDHEVSQLPAAAAAPQQQDECVGATYVAQIQSVPGKTYCVCSQLTCSTLDPKRCNSDDARTGCHVIASIVFYGLTGQVVQIFNNDGLHVRSFTIDKQDKFAQFLRTAVGRVIYLQVHIGNNDKHCGTGHHVVLAPSTASVTAKRPRLLTITPADPNAVSEVLDDSHNNDGGRKEKKEEAIGSSSDQSKASLMCVYQAYGSAYMHYEIGYWMGSSSAPRPETYGSSKRQVSLLTDIKSAQQSYGGGIPRPSEDIISQLMSLFSTEQNVWNKAYGALFGCVPSGKRDFHQFAIEAVTADVFDKNRSGPFPAFVNMFSSDKCPHSKSWSFWL